MAPSLTEDEIDDLLYFARTGDMEEFNSTSNELYTRENATPLDILAVAKDEHSGNGPLHMAAANGHTALVQDICKSLTNPSPQSPAMLAIVNAQNISGNTPLHWAALNGHLEAVKVLLEHGADPTITNQKGHDPIYEAELNDKSDVVEWVLKEGGDGLEEGVAGGAEGEVDEEMEDSPAGPSGTEGNPVVYSSVEEAMADLDVKNPGATEKKG